MNLQSEIENVLLKHFWEGFDDDVYVRAIKTEIAAEIMELIKRTETKKVFEDLKASKKWGADTDIAAIEALEIPEKIKELPLEHMTIFSQTHANNLSAILDKINELVRAHNKQYD